MGIINTWWVRKSQREVAEALGLPSGTVRSWRADGMPGERGQWDLVEILKWAIATGRFGERPATLTPDEDLLVGDGDSEGLERFRMARAQQEEIKLAEKRGQIILTERFGDCARLILSPLRRLQDTFKRKQDHDAFRLVEEAIDEMDRGLADLESTGE